MTTDAAATLATLAERIRGALPGAVEFMEGADIPATLPRSLVADFPGAAFFHPFSPFTSIDPGRISSTVGEDFPVCADLLGVDGDDDALATEHFRRLADEVGTIDCAGIDRNFVGAGFEQRTNVFRFVDAAADRERHENLLGGSRHHIENDTAIFMGRSDVEKA